MSQKKFNELFNLTPSLDQERQAFVQRINQTFFSYLKQRDYPDNYRDVFTRLCYELGLNAEDLLSEANLNHYGSLIIPDIRTLTQDKFEKTLRILIILHAFLKQDNVEALNTWVDLAISCSSLDLGIRWVDGMFYPSGAKELDEKLISDNLEWLKQYVPAQKSFSTALERFKKSAQDPASRKDAITNAYTAMEQVAQFHLKNERNFDKNYADLVTSLNLPSQYKNIFFYYKQIANEYSSRHAGEELSHSETEMFIYMTGLLMRTILQQHK